MALRNCLFILWAFCLLSTTAQAQLGGGGGGGQPVDWGNAPLACLPTRVVPWDGISHASACHCPPTSQCPSAGGFNLTPADVNFNVTLITSAAAIAQGYGWGDYQVLPTTTADAITFTVSGADVANYMQNYGSTTPNYDGTLNVGSHGPMESYFDPTQVFMLQDNPLFGCSFGPYRLNRWIGTKTGSHVQGQYNLSFAEAATWGSLQDYIRPVVQQYLNNPGTYLIQQGLPYYPQGANAGYNDYTTIGYNGLCTNGIYIDYSGSVYQYSVTVTVSGKVAQQQQQQALQWPPVLMTACCPQSALFQCPQENISALNQNEYTDIYNSDTVFGFVGANVSTITQTSSGNTLSCQLRAWTLHISCLLEGTPVVTADGKTKKIEDIKVGDHLKGYDGKKDVTVQAMNRYTQSADELFGFNGGKAFITAEHPLLTTEGWKSVNPDKTKVKSIAPVGKLKVGDKIITRDGMLEIFSIDRYVMSGKPKVYNLSVEGGDGFIANDMVVKGFSQVQVHY